MQASMIRFTQPNAAAPRRPAKEQPAADPVGSLSVEERVELAVQLAAAAASQSSGPVSVEVGGIKIKLTPAQADPHKPVAVLDEPAEARSPAVATFLDDLRSGQGFSMRATTRGGPGPAEEPQVHRPEAPGPFDANRLEVSFRTASGEPRAMILQAEAVVGHLAEVVPGETRVGGHISVSDPSDDRNEIATLTRDEQDALLASLYARFDQPMTHREAEVLNAAISYASAIRFDGEGAQAVRDRHAQLAGQEETYQQMRDRWASDSMRRFIDREMNGDLLR
ncbi:MAG: hypothetical protein AB1758_22215 [Candidatus Eremiobacterota bacterium]